VCLVEFLLSLGDVRKRLGVNTALSQPGTEPQSRGGAGSRALVQHLLQSQKVGPLPQLGVTAAHAWEGHQTTGPLLEISLWNGTCVPGALGPISQPYPAATGRHTHAPAHPEFHQQPEGYEARAQGLICGIAEVRISSGNDYHSQLK